MYFRQWLFQIEQQHILSVTLKWKFLICSTAQCSLKTPPLSSSTPLYIYLPSILSSQGRLSPLRPLAQIPPNLIGHPSFMELDFSPWGNCKRRRREAAIAPRD